ncbi:hypothetical protein Q3G72_010833 [Acer saccharum]|nr:hypothetical protein Q3G72_010833 [Acer saccharum]
MSHDIDVEQGQGRRRRRRRRSSVSGSDDDDDDNVSVCFSDAEDDAGSCYSQFYSTRGGSYDEYSFACVTDDPEISGGGGGGGGGGSRRASSVSSASSDRSVEINESEIPEIEIKIHVGNKVEAEKDCRICHLGLESNSHESGAPIQLGCSCKDDLAAAHRQCAEAWFKIRGNKICEICHSVARNVAGATEIESIEQSNEASNATAMAAVSASTPHGDHRSIWQGHRFLNFLLACMVFAFVISWLFHFNVPSS